MALLRRHAPSHLASDPSESTSATDLHKSLDELVAYINLNAGRLPSGAVVSALWATDAIRAIIDSAGDRPLDIHVLVSVEGLLGDYLPTTLHSYLSLDPTVTGVKSGSGRTPRDLAVEQTRDLWLASVDLLTATQAQDADALVTQGNFLRTKFSQSDLSL